MIGNTKADFIRWFQRGKEEKARWMIMVCDTFDYEDYPVYVKEDEDFHKEYDKYDDKNMQKIMEVYDLNMDFEEQFRQERCFNMPDLEE